MLTFDCRYTVSMICIKSSCGILYISSVYSFSVLYATLGIFSVRFPQMVSDTISLVATELAPLHTIGIGFLPDA